MDKIARQLTFNFKYTIGNKYQLITISVFLLMAILLPVALVPLKYSFPLTILFSSTLPTGIIYIATTFNLRKGTLYSNQKITNNSRSSFYISSYLLMIIFGLILLFITLITLTILSQLDLLLGNYWWSTKGTSDYHYKIMKVPFVALMYSFIESITITFALCFLMQNIINDIRVMYIVFTSMMILTMIFGGTFNDYFNNSTGNFILDDGTISPIAIAVASNGLMPKEMFGVCSMFPYFAPGQHLAVVGMKTIYVDIEKIQDTTINDVLNMSSESSGLIARYPDMPFFYWQEAGTYYSLTNDVEKIVSNKDSFYWNVMWFYSYIWVFGLFIIGSIIGKIKGN